MVYSPALLFWFVPSILDEIVIVKEFYPELDMIIRWKEEAVLSVSASGDATMTEVQRMTTFATYRGQVRQRRCSDEVFVMFRHRYL